jgi:hypothetical protein
VPGSGVAYAISTLRSRGWAAFYAQRAEIAEMEELLTNHMGKILVTVKPNI